MWYSQKKSFLLWVIWIVFPFSFINLARSLSVLMIFPKSQLLVSLLFSIVFCFLLQWFLLFIIFFLLLTLGFPCGSAGKESTFNGGRSGLIPGLGRSPGEGKRDPLQYSWLENPMDRGVWQVTVHGVIKSQTRLKRLSIHTHCLHSGCSQLTFQHRWRMLLISPYPLQFWFFGEYLTMAILVWGDTSL